MFYISIYSSRNNIPDQRRKQQLLSGLAWRYLRYRYRLFTKLHSHQSCLAFRSLQHTEAWHHQTPAVELWLVIDARHFVLCNLLQPTRQSTNQSAASIHLCSTYNACPQGRRPERTPPCRMPSQRPTMDPKSQRHPRNSEP